MKKILWLLFGVFVWTLKYVLWLPVMTIELYEGRAKGEMRIAFAVAVPMMWSVFAPLIITAFTVHLGLLLALLVAYLLIGIFGAISLSFADDGLDNANA